MIAGNLPDHLLRHLGSHHGHRDHHLLVHRGTTFRIESLRSCPVVLAALGRAHAVSMAVGVTGERTEYVQ